MGAFYYLRIVKVVYFDSEDIEKNGTDVLDDANAILVPGGFGERGIEGKIKTPQIIIEDILIL